MGTIKRWGKQIANEHTDFVTFCREMDVAKWIARLKYYIKARVVYLVDCKVWYEGPLSDWFKKHGSELGYSEILQEHTPRYNQLKQRMSFYGFPDFLGRKGTKWHRVEIECFSSDFFKNHNLQYADLILCYDIDKTIEGIPCLSLKEIVGAEEIINHSEIPEFLYLYDSEFVKAWRNVVVNSMRRVMEFIGREAEQE